MQKNLRQFQIHFPSENAEIYLIGPFNDWGKNLLEEYKFSNEKYPVYSLNYSLEHKTPYLFQINGKIYRDPSTIVFDENLNSVYWDFNDPRAYKQKYPQVNLKEKSLKILQTYLPGLITHFADKKGRLGMEVPQKDYYSFITNSGVIDKIKDLGFNGIQFLPVAKAIDGDNWKFRYLSSYPGSIEDHWGDPDSFAEMVDAFHEKKIAVFNDSVLSHSPSKDFRMNGISSVDSALPMSYFGEVTQWGTNRYKYNDPYIREFLVENTVNFIKNYKVDGFRIDNVDGILRFGENGEGKERPGARTFLRELNREIYSTNKNAIVTYEAHFFSEDNAKLLIAPIDSGPEALGATAYSSSRETYFFQTDYMPKSADDIRASRIREIIEEKEWGQSNSCIADFHNHDAAAGLMDMRATGSYAYDALTLGHNYLHFHAIGKIKVMEAIISLCLEGRTLDLLQSFLLQLGSFEHDSSIHWFLEEIEASRAMVNFKKRINEIMDHKDFWFKNISGRKILDADDIKKTLTINKGSHLIFINMSSDLLYNYPVKVGSEGIYQPIFNSDEFQYCGMGTVKIEDKYESKPGLKIKIDQVAPYQILVFKKIRTL